MWNFLYNYILSYIYCKRHMKCRFWYAIPQEFSYMRWDISYVITEISHEKYEIFIRFPMKKKSSHWIFHQNFTVISAALRKLFVKKSNFIWNFMAIYMLYELSREMYTKHYTDVIMGAMTSQIINLTIVWWTVYLDADHRKHQSFASLAFVRGIPRTNGQ